MQLRFNGTAPAWPHLLGTMHPFYPVDEPAFMGSASYSVLENNNGSGWEILIDAGHNTLPFLLQNRNRIPDVVMLTHAHPDHILGIDWVVQSNRFKHPEKLLPLYCTRLVFDRFMQIYGHCGEYVEFRELFYGQSFSIAETPGVEITAYPVFHGAGGAGAVGFFIRNTDPKQQSVLLTGDLLCPLFRKADYELLQHASALVVDTNNLLPCPASNHISLAATIPGDEEKEPLLQRWFQTVSWKDYLQAHNSGNEGNTSYFDTLQHDFTEPAQLPHTIMELLKWLPIPEVHLVHYFGKYDELYYNRGLLTREELVALANETAGVEKIRTRFRVPVVGGVIKF